MAQAAGTEPKICEYWEMKIKRNNKILVVTGNVRYIGNPLFASTTDETWVGVELIPSDAKYAKNDGIVNGTCYFHTEKGKSGLFVKLNALRRNVSNLTNINSNTNSNSKNSRRSLSRKSLSSKSLSISSELSEDNNSTTPTSVTTNDSTR